MSDFEEQKKEIYDQLYRLVTQAQVIEAITIDQAQLAMHMLDPNEEYRHLRPWAYPSRNSTTKFDYKNIVNPGGGLDEK